MTDLKKFSLIVGGCYVILVVIALTIAGMASDADADAFSKIAIVSVSVITGLATIAVNLFTSNRTSELSREMFAFTKNMELLKNRLSKEQTAYDKLLDAANGLYGTLSEGETGAFDRGEFKVANRAMNAAKVYLTLCTPDDENKWYAFWQKGKKTADDFEKLTSNLQKDLWRTEAVALGKLLNDFQDAAEEVYKKSMPEK